MTSSTHTPNAARSPLATQGLGVAYATGAIISAQFGAALAKQLMGDLGPWGVVDSAPADILHPAVGVLPPADSFVDSVSSGWRSLSSVSP